jgi:transposase InsO family protein
MIKNESQNSGWASPKALIRYDVVRFLEEAVKSGFSLSRALALASERLWGERRYSIPVMERWYYQYRLEGFRALEPAPRQDKGHVRALSPEALEAFLRLRKTQPHVHVTTLLRQLEKEGIVPPHTVSLTTLYRVLIQAGLDRRSLVTDLTGPTKAFEVSWANQLWMTDGMVGPTLVSKNHPPVRTHLLALLDDCSRLCPHAQYYPAERLECFLDLFKHALQARGLPDKLYTDNGALFVSQHLQTVCANFGIRLIHAKPYAAWSKGKIERFFSTVQSDFEQRLVFEPAKDLAELNQRFWTWLESEYHQRAHQGLEGQSPAARFQARAQGLRLIPAEMDVEALFLSRTHRRVRRDATLSLEGRIWEVPVALRGREIQVHYDPFTWKRVELYLQGQKVGCAHPCDKQLNARCFNGKTYDETP